MTSKTGWINGRKRIQRPTAWMESARCRVENIPTNVFFTDIAAAKAICDGCPVAYECRRHAFETEETVGIWGGVNFAEWKHPRSEREEKCDPRIREAYRRVWRRLPEGSEARKAMRKLSDRELELLAAQEDYI